MRDLLTALNVVLGGLEEDLIPDERPGDTKFFDYHLLPVAEWGNSMEVARRALVDARRYWTGEERFLDVGCGIGSKLRLASAIGWKVSGIERWEPYANVARRAGFDVQTVEASDYLSYFDFDLVYMYRLCVDIEAEEELVRLIVDRMAPGTLLFHAGGPDPTYLDHVGEHVWWVG